MNKKEKQEFEKLLIDIAIIKKMVFLLLDYLEKKQKEKVPIIKLKKYGRNIL